MRFLLLLCVLGCSLPGEEPSASVPFKGPSQPPEQMIFFAVLEGLYRDGVSTAAASSIAVLDPESGIPLNFVYNCPLCMPALNAFRVYLERPDFLGNKAGSNTFGGGLDAWTLERVLSGDRETRLDALHGLVQGWVEIRLGSLNLTRGQRTAWGRQLSAMREKGNALLAEYQEQEEGPYAEFYSDWKRCAVCDGSSDAGEWEDPQ